jgi:hypothetical protein
MGWERWVGRDGRPRGDGRRRSLSCAPAGAWLRLRSGQHGSSGRKTPPKRKTTNILQPTVHQSSLLASPRKPPAPRKPPLKACVSCNCAGPKRRGRHRTRKHFNRHFTNVRQCGFLIEDRGGEPPVRSHREKPLPPQASWSPVSLLARVRCAGPLQWPPDAPHTAPRLPARTVGQACQAAVSVWHTTRAQATLGACMARLPPGGPGCNDQAAGCNPAWLAAGDHQLGHQTDLI